MATWEAIVSNTVYQLSDGAPFWRLQATGLGIPNIRNIKQRGPYQHGSTRRDYRIDERLLNLMFLLKGATCAQADQLRDNMVEIFKPATDYPVQIRVTRDDGQLRQLDAYAVGVMDFPETPEDRFVSAQRVAMQLEATDPFWYDPQMVQFGFSAVTGGAEGFQIPMEIPWDQEPGEVIDVVQTVQYMGNISSFPVITITGPAIDARITNAQTGEKLDFTGATIADGDIRIIDLRYGTKTVKDIDGVLMNSELTSDSSLGTFHLAASPQAPSGLNDLLIEVPFGATTDTRVDMFYYNRYLHL